MELFKHQQKIIDEDPKRCGLWLGTGSGKSRIALLLARGKTLVICPKTQKEDRNWYREKEKLNLILDLTVISKEIFRRDHAALSRYDTVICDEAHTALGVTPNIRWRNKKPIPKASQIFEALQEFVERTKPERLYLVTATIIKSPMTVWGAAKILGKEWNFHKFRDTFYFKLPMPGRDVWQAKSDKDSKEHLAKLVKSIGYVGRLEDYFDVPEQTYKTIYVELTKKQKDRIKEMAIEFPDPLVRCGKIHQIENGCLSGDEFSDPEVFDNAKIEKILDLALEFPRMVIFCKYKAQIAQIASSLKKEGKKVLTLTGDTKDRGEVILEANRSKECIFIAQAQVSSGWELPEYPVMIFASRTYSYVDFLQGCGRILRANALKKNLFINLVVKGGVDEMVDKCLANKQDFSEILYGKK